MKIASIVYSTEQGLGYLAKDFYDNGLITTPIILRHQHRANHPEWFGNGITVHSPTQPAIRSVLRSADIALFFETPFDWTLIRWCRQHRVKTVLMPMHECMPATWPDQPDLILNPSHLEQRLYPNGIHIPVPIPQWVKWRERTEAKVFVHNAGHGGLGGRNGTAEVIAAMEYVKSDARLILRSQKPINPSLEIDLLRTGKVRTVTGSVPQDELYDEGDVFLFPEKNNGLSLPMQEAFASGMVVMCGARFPMTEWLPVSPMIKVDRYTQESIRRGWQPFEKAHYSPQEIALRIDAWYGKPIGPLSRLGKTYAEQNSWDNLKPQYVKAFEDLLQ